MTTKMQTGIIPIDRHVPNTVTIDTWRQPVCQHPETISGIVNAFECIGQQTMTFKTPSSAVTTAYVERLQRYIKLETGISPAQARLFSARVLEYCPPPGATPDAVRADLDQEMLDVLLDPQTRAAVSSVAPTGVAGIDHLRTNGAWELSVAGPWGKDEMGGPRHLTTIEPQYQAVLSLRMDPIRIDPMIDEMRKRLEAGTTPALHRVDIVPAAPVYALIASIRRILDLR